MMAAAVAHDSQTAMLLQTGLPQGAATKTGHISYEKKS